MTVGIAGGLSHGGMESCSQEGVFELEPGDCDRVYSDIEIECCAGLSTSGAVSMRRRRFDDERRMVEDWPTSYLLGGRWLGDTLK